MREAGKLKIIVPDDIGGSFQSSPNITRLNDHAVLSFFTARPSNEEDLIERIRTANIVVTFRPAFTKFPKHVLAAAHGLRMICISGTGVEDVDVAEATARKIAVANVPGPSNRAVAEHCLALAFSVARHIGAQDRAIRGGQWKAMQGIELGGKTLGIVGISGISSELASLARGIGMKVVSWSRNNDSARASAVGSQAVAFDELLATADVVSLHVRLNDATRHMIGADQLARMKRSAILINTARGGVVDTHALVNALARDQIGGAGLDVFEQEPLLAGHPFFTLDNVVMTPVSAWSTADASARMINQSIENVAQFLAGTPVNIVNPVVLGS